MMHTDDLDMENSNICDLVEEVSRAVDTCTKMACDESEKPEEWLEPIVPESARRKMYEAQMEIYNKFVKDRSLKMIPRTRRVQYPPLGTPISEVTSTVPTIITNIIPAPPSQEKARALKSAFGRKRPHSPTDETVALDELKLEIKITSLNQPGYEGDGRYGNY